MPQSHGSPAAPSSVQSWTRLVWVGEVDCYSVEPLAATLRAVGEHEAVTLEVDLSGVTFMDCAGLTPLLEARTRLPEQLRLFAPSRPVTRLLDLLGLERLFTVVRPAAPTSELNLSWPVDDDAHSRRTDELLSGLPRVLSDRATIEQAKGLLMGAHGCDAASAWDLLRGAARTHDVRIREMARMLVDNASGGLASDGLAPGGLPGGFVPGGVASGGFAWGGLTRSQLAPAAQAVADDVLAELARSGPTDDSAGAY